MVLKASTSKTHFLRFYYNADHLKTGLMIGNLVRIQCLQSVTGNMFFDMIFYQQTGDREKDILTETLPRISFKGNAGIEPKETKPAIDPVSERQRALCKKPDCGSKE